MKKIFIAQLFHPNSFDRYASRLYSNVGWRFASDILRRRWIGPLIISAALLFCLLLVGYGSWLLQLERGARALAHGDTNGAAEIYASAERPFHSVLARVFPGYYGRTVFPQVALLYNHGKANDAAGKLERSAARSPALAERPEFSFWNGNIFLRRALENSDPDIIIKNLYAAAGHYRKALESAPGDWDVKYNYELVQYILAEQEKEKEKDEARMKSVLERIRTVTEPAPKEPPPPEKRG